MKSGSLTEKNELSLVDKIELGRAYQPHTGQNCFKCTTLEEYANFLVPELQSCSAQEATIVLSSTAGAAEYQGSKLGEFVEAGEHGGKPFYRQRDTEGSSETFLYSEWLVG